jgi:6-phosphogluconolactonase
MANYIGYIGTNNFGKDSGLRVVEADGETGELRLLQHVEYLDTPVYFAVSGGLVVASGSDPAAPSERRGVVSTLKIGEDGTLTPINAVASSSYKAPCHICVSPDGRFVYASHYGEGQNSVYSIAENGEIWGPIQVITHEGHGPHPQQDVPHIHFGGFTPDGKYLLHCDLGLDVIHVYKPDGDGLLTKVKDVPVVLGAGARHLAFSHDGRFCWVLSEMRCLVTAFAYHDGEFTLLETVPTLTEDYPEQAISAIKLSPDGSLLFAGNRFRNSITVFRVKDDGTLTRTAEVPCDLPREFAVLPNGKFFYICGQDDNRVEVFRIDYAAGTLVKTGFSLDVPVPTCISFMA